MKRMVIGTIGTEGRYLKLRLLAPGLLLLHLGVRLIHPAPTKASDLLLFNLVAFVAALVAWSSPSFNDTGARYCLTLALALWAVASLISSWNSFATSQVLRNFPDIGYSLFYPLLLLGLLRALTAREGFDIQELLDVIITLGGLCGVLALFALRYATTVFTGPASSIYLAILYPLGDLISLALGVVVMVMQGVCFRSLLLMGGIAIFTATDLYFLWSSATTGYGFASLTDDGWLLGIILIAESLWHPGQQNRYSNRVSSFAASASFGFTAVVLSIAALRHNSIPTFALIPALATIALSFARMALALRRARLALIDREMALTDELTGLANRRQLIAELDQLGSQDATLLLMDLDGFKAVNDTLGHEIGDQLLVQIGLRFKKVLGTGDLLARLGGDEFAVVTYGLPHNGLETSQAIRATLSYPFILAGSAIKVDISIGRIINDAKPDLMRRADSAMYEAKRSGLGVVLWQP
jgi:diguanylate cyclase (GGDEF)-like protein